MIFSVLLVLGVCLVPAHSKPAGRLQSSHCGHLSFFSNSLLHLNFPCVTSLVKFKIILMNKSNECVVSLQKNIWAVLSFKPVLKRQRNLWMMHTSTPEKSELIFWVILLYDKLISLSIVLMKAIHYTSKKDDSFELIIPLCLSLLQESETSPQGSGETSRCSPSVEAASGWHTLSCKICRLHGTDLPSA